MGKLLGWIRRTGVGSILDHIRGCSDQDTPPKYLSTKDRLNHLKQAHLDLYKDYTTKSAECDMLRKQLDDLLTYHEDIGTLVVTGDTGTMTFGEYHKYTTALNDALALKIAWSELAEYVDHEQYKMQEFTHRTCPVLKGVRERMNDLHLPELTKIDRPRKE